MAESPYRKKLIDVTLPLEAINAASIREKAIRHGHPSTLHTWWSRKPLAACRAILFASLVDDPSERSDEFPGEEAQEQERQRLLTIIKELVIWENSQNEDVLRRARDEIHPSPDCPIPPIRDPFCGGGSIPLEAQRLGLRARSSDLNPVAVLITKALIEIPPSFAGHPAIAPATPDVQHALVEGQDTGAQGLAHDIRYYGRWMRDEAERRIGHLYPKMTLPAEYGGGEGTVIAWLWARTVKCPNPACGAQMPLANKWWLSKKAGKPVWIEPVVNMTNQPATVDFFVRRGRQGSPPEGTVNRNGARCLVCETSVAFDHIRHEGKSGRMGAQLLAIVAEGQQGRIYTAPTQQHVMIAQKAMPINRPEADLPTRALGFRVQLYGMTKYGDLFTPRQLVALTTFSDLVQEVRERVLADAQQVAFPADERPLHDGGKGANAYADAIATYLALAIDRLADRNSSICSWDVTRDSTRNTFAQQAIPMIWDFAEANPFSASTGNFLGAIDWVAEVIQRSPCDQHGESTLGIFSAEEWAPVVKNPNQVYQRDATVTLNGVTNVMIVTDPPYYDSIGFAALSDFFYVWLRRSLKDIYPGLFQTLLTPKDVELVADPYRFGGSKEKAQAFFEQHLYDIFAKMHELQNKHYPLILFYAHKQDEAFSSTGWATMLGSLVRTGFMITGTWPVRTEMLNRSGGLGTNALASSIVLVCRPRPVEAEMISRRRLLKELRDELPPALRKLQHGEIAPVDLAQACIGPGMAIYSRYSQIVESDGTPLHVHTALQLINRTIDEILSAQDSEYDAETSWIIAWYEQYALETGPYGSAETLSKAKNISVNSLERMGLVRSTGGYVRLCRRDEFSPYHPSVPLKTVWECMQRMIYALNDSKGIREAALILRHAGEQGALVLDLAYRLYTLCDRKGWTDEAFAYNGLVTSWSEMNRYARNEYSTLLQTALPLHDAN